MVATITLRNVLTCYVVTDARKIGNLCRGHNDEKEKTEAAGNTYKCIFELKVMKDLHRHAQSGIDTDNVSTSDCNFV